MTNFDRAMAYLEKLPDAIEGSGGHNATLRAACECIRFGLSGSEIQEAMGWFNDNRCRPKWSAKELAHKIESAQSKAIQGERAMNQAFNGKGRTFMPSNKPLPNKKPGQSPDPLRRIYDTKPFDAVAWAQKMIADKIDFTTDEMVTLSGPAAADAWRKWAGIEQKAIDQDEEYWNFIMEQG